VPAFLRPRRPVRIAALAPVATLVAGCGGSAQLDEPAVSAPVVAVEAARVETVRNAIGMSGTVVAAASADWIVHAPEAGQIVELPKQEGDAVEAGDLLVRLEVPSITQELSTRQLEHAEAQRRADEARAEAERRRVLVERGVLPRNDYDAARAALSGAETTLTQTRTQLELAQSLAQRTEIRARFPGIVAARWHQAGEFVTGDSADPILRVFDPTRIQVAVQLTATELARVPPGQIVTIQSAMTPPVPGRVVSRPTAPEPGAAAAEVRIDFLEAVSIPLSTPVLVDAKLGEIPDAVTVPQAAVAGEGNDRYVMVVGPDSVARRRDIRLGLIVDGRAQILQGVSAGDTVVVRGLEEIADGDSVIASR
jgi:RND family efflux transporter MFP subunit